MTAPLLPDGPVLSRRSVLGGLLAGGTAMAFGVGFAGCTPTAYFPTTDASWATITPAAAGWDATKLAAAIDFAFTRKTSALVIAYDGKLMAERYTGAGHDASWATDVFSVQKSVISLLLTIAADKGLLAFGDVVTKHLGVGWTNATTAQEAPITVQHLASMSSGLNNDLTFYRTPGTMWAYNTNAYQQLGKVLEAAAGQDLMTLSTAWLFGPIGALHSTWGIRMGAGGVVLDPKGEPIKDLLTSARDLARFGLLVQRDGMWGATRVVPSAGLTTAISTSQPMNPSYGRLWWLNGQSGYIVPTGGNVLVPGPLLPHAPSDLVAALGFNDQKIYVTRSRKLVVTRIGNKASDATYGDLGDFDDLFWQQLMLAAPA